MLEFALHAWRFRARSRQAARFEVLDHDASQRWSADPAVGEDYYHVQWIALPDQGPFAGETWLIGDQPWPDAPEFIMWGLGCRGVLGVKTRFNWMFQEWPELWLRQTAMGAGST